jgi:hypothetical protein
VSASQWHPFCAWVSAPDVAAADSAHSVPGATLNVLMAIKLGWTRQVAEMEGAGVQATCSPLYAHAPRPAAVWIVGGSGLGRWLGADTASLTATELLVICVRSDSEADYLQRLVLARISLVAAMRPCLTVTFAHLHDFTTWSCMLPRGPSGACPPSSPTPMPARGVWSDYWRQLLCVAFAWQVYACADVTSACGALGSSQAPLRDAWGVRVLACLAAVAVLVCLAVVQHVAASVWSCSRAQRGAAVAGFPPPALPSEPSCARAAAHGVGGRSGEASAVGSRMARAVAAQQLAVFVAGAVRQWAVDAGRSEANGVNICTSHTLSRELDRALSTQGVGKAVGSVQQGGSDGAAEPLVMQGSHATFRCAVMCGEW